MAQDGPPVPPRIGFPIDYYKFLDTNWASTFGYAPRSTYGIEAVAGIATNWAVRVGSSTPAWLQYNYVENDGRTNLAYPGALTFWVRPATWASTNFEGGTGPGVPARLFEAGGYAGDGSFGMFSLHLNSEGSLLVLEAQSNASGGIVLQAPVAWSTEWHMVGINASTNFVELYLDGELAAWNTNGLGFWPSDAVLLTNGLFWGSDFTGSNTAGSDFCLMRLYDFPIMASSISAQYWRVMTNYIQGGNENSPNRGEGEGPLLPEVNCPPSGLNLFIESIIDNILTLRICNGGDGVYDLFSITNMLTLEQGATWNYIGRTTSGQTQIVLTNLPSFQCYFQLGLTNDTDLDGRSDAYEWLVSHTDPYTNLPPFRVYITEPSNLSILP